MRVERQNGDARGMDAEIAHKRAVEHAQFFQHCLARYGLRHLIDGQMCGPESHTHVVAAQHHERTASVVASERCFEIFRVAREGELGAVYVVLVDGRCHEHIYVPLAQVGHGAFQRRTRGFAGGGGFLSGLHLAVFAHYVDDVYSSVACVGGVGCLCKLHGLHAEGLAVECRYFGRAVHYRRTHLQDACVVEGLKNHFIAYAVYVAVGYSHAYQSFAHFSVGLLWLLSLPASIPQAASMSSPREARIVAVTPRSFSRSRKASIVFWAEGCIAPPGMAW